MLDRPLGWANVCKEFDHPPTALKLQCQEHVGCQKFWNVETPDSEQAFNLKSWLMSFFKGKFKMKTVTIYVLKCQGEGGVIEKKFSSVDIPKLT